MGVPLSCGPVLVWFPVERSIDLSFGLGNQGVYAIGARPVPARSGLWGGLPSVGVEPGRNLIGVEAQQPSELEMWDAALLRPGVERRTLDPEALRQCGYVKAVLHQSL